MFHLKLRMHKHQHLWHLLLKIKPNNNNNYNKMFNRGDEIQENYEKKEITEMK